MRQGISLPLAVVPRLPYCNRAILTDMLVAGEAMLRGEFEKLLHILRPESSMDKADLQILKDKVFGPQTFFVTESRLTDDFSPDAGWLVSALVFLRDSLSACSTDLAAHHRMMHGWGLLTC